MNTERHNIACRLIVKAIAVGSLGRCFAQMVGSEDSLPLQNLQTPEGSTIEPSLDGFFPRRFPAKQRLTACRPDAVLVTEIPSKRRIASDAHPRYALRSTHMHPCCFSRLETYPPRCYPSMLLTWFQAFCVLALDCHGGFASQRCYSMRFSTNIKHAQRRIEKKKRS